MLTITNKNRTGSIIYSIDTISIVFNNCSIVDVFNSLHLPYESDPDYDRMLADSFYRASGYSSDLVINYCGCGLQIHAKDIYAYYTNLDKVIEEDVSVFSTLKWPYIRLDAMGGALDNLRSLGFDVEQVIMSPLDVPEDGSYHYTRCDFAFDLFDYAPMFIDDIREAARLYGGRPSFDSPYVVWCNGFARGIGFSSRTGDQDTIYLGKGSGDRCLRLYDKKLEQGSSYNADKFKFYGQLGYLPESWIRIELQTRRDVGQLLIDQSKGDALSIFRFIYDHYGIREGQSVNNPVCKIWLDLFDWDVIPRIIQNANCVTVYYDPVDRAETYVDLVATSSIVRLVANYGWEWLIEHINDNIIKRQKSTDIGLLRSWTKLYSSTFSPKRPSPSHWKVTSDGFKYL